MRVHPQRQYSSSTSAIAGTCLALAARSRSCTRAAAIGVIGRQRRWIWPTLVAIMSSALVIIGDTVAQTAQPRPPQSLSDTGLYADFPEGKVDLRHLAFAPQYPLWTDGASKRRWISLPEGAAIDASDPEAWEFPPGTRLWKEFAFDGRPVETRMIERLPDGQWRFAAYEWDADGREAVLAPERGRRGAYPLAGGRSHTIPGVADCKACHMGSGSVVLGFDALQLSPDRDPNALHAEAPPAPGIDLDYLADRGLLVGLPERLRETPPRIDAATPVERSALGYLHGNCGHCHNQNGPLRNLKLFLFHTADAEVEPARASTLGHPVRDPAPGQTPEAIHRVEAGSPERSVLYQRMASRYALLQMPPLGTELVDEDAVQLISSWIEGEGVARSEVRRASEGDGG